MDDASDVDDYNVAEDDDIFSEDEVSNYSSDDAADITVENNNLLNIPTQLNDWREMNDLEKIVVELENNN